MRRFGRSAAFVSAVGLAPLPAHAAECTVARLAELPVTMVSRKATVPVKINGRPAQFAIDSGAFFSFVPAAVVSDNKLSTYAAPFGLHVMGVNGEADVSLTKIKTFTLAGTDVHNIEFLVGGSALNGLSGLIGQNVLHIADVEYDLAGGAIRLLRPHGCGRADLAYWAAGKPYSVLPVTPQRGPNSQAAAAVTVNGVRLTAVLDTGADTSVLTLAGARRAKIDVHAPGVVRAGLSGGIGRKLLQTWIAPVASFGIGDERITTTRLRVGDLALDDADMLLGADFFLSHRVYVANSQQRVYFTYNGGPVFDLKVRDSAPPAEPVTAAVSPPVAAAPPVVGEPADAEGLSRRAAAFAARRDYAAALADLSRAVAMAPQERRYLRQRAEVRLALRQPYLAMGDLDVALKLDAADVEAHLLRAQLRAAGRDPAGELADLDAASAAASRGADLRLRLGQLYAAAFAYEKAVGEYDAWIAAHGEDEHLGAALTGRAWARDMLGRDLDKALSDADRAVRLRPGTAAPLNARGMARLRRGELDRAVADYDAALRAEPRYAWALYGRGLAKLRKGMAAEGQADTAAAVGLDAHIADLGRRFGVTADTPPKGRGAPSTSGPAPPAG